MKLESQTELEYTAKSEKCDNMANDAVRVAFSVQMAEEKIDDSVAEEKTETEIAAISELVKVPVQPLPPKDRKVFTFTKNTSLGVTPVDGVMPSERTADLRPVHVKEVSYTALALVSQTKQLPPQPARPKAEYPVLVSGIKC